MKQIDEQQLVLDIQEAIICGQMNEPVKRWDLTNEKDLKKIQKRTFISYKKYTGKTEGREDCFQEVIEYYLAGKGQHQTIDQSVIDYLRRTSGDKRLPVYSKKQNLNNANSIESESFRNISDGRYGIDLENRLCVEQVVRMSRHWEKAIMSLFFMEGYGQVEIADFFGVSGSRVYQWLQRIQKRISTKIKFQEQRENSRKMASILSKEAKGNEGGMEQFAFERMEIGQSFGAESFSEASF